MKYHEDDQELKISKWYLKLPQSVLNCVSDFGLFLHRLLAKVKNM